jgi:hypothetical protein
MKRFNDLVASAAKHAMTEPELDAWLTQHRVTDPTERIAVKLSLQASGELASDQHISIGELATDRARQPTPGTAATPELDRWMRRARIDSTRDYRDDELTDLFRASDLGLEERVAVRHHLGSLGRLRAGAEVTPTPRPTTITAKRTMQAASTPRPKGTKLLNPDGSARTLTFLP